MLLFSDLSGGGVHSKTTLFYTGYLKLVRYNIYLNVNVKQTMLLGVSIKIYIVTLD